MANTTQSKVIIIAPELTSLDSDLWELVLSDVALLVTSGVYGTSQEIAQRYLCAHMLTVLKNINGGDGSIDESSFAGATTKEKIDDIEKDYSNLVSDLKNGNRYDTTMYGVQFNIIRKRVLLRYKYYKPDEN